MSSAGDCASGVLWSPWRALCGLLGALSALVLVVVLSCPAEAYGGAWRVIGAELGWLLLGDRAGAGASCRAGALMPRPGAGGTLDSAERIWRGLVLVVELVAVVLVLSSGGRRAELAWRVVGGAGGWRWGLVARVLTCPTCSDHVGPLCFRGIRFPFLVVSSYVCEYTF